MDPTTLARIKYIRDSGFGRISDAIGLMYGTPELSTYLESLILNTTDRHIREGFPPDVFDCLMKIYHTDQTIKNHSLGEGMYEN